MKFYFSDTTTKIRRWNNESWTSKRYPFFLVGAGRQSAKFLISANDHKKKLLKPEWLQKFAVKWIKAEEDKRQEKSERKREREKETKTELINNKEIENGKEANE